MKNKYIFVIGLGVVVVLVVAYFSITSTLTPDNMQPIPNTQLTEQKFKTPESTPAQPDMVTVSGTYVCLPPIQGGEVTADCAFGIQTDDGEYYAVNFGARAGSMADFRDGARITAKGTIILREDLNPDSWTKFTMKGLFTVMEKM